MRNENQCHQATTDRSAQQEPSTDESKRGLYIRTFGCQMNEYDSEKLAKILEADYRLVGRPEDADLVLINTCSVREKPEHKLYSLLGQIRELKEQNRNLMIGVGGCVAQQEGKNIVKRCKAVDFVFGTHNLSLVPSLITQRREGAPPQVAVDYRDEWEELPLGYVESKISVFVSISRGCNKNCSYCIVPTTRGKEVSRDPKEIEREVRIAVQRGAREVILLGQTVNSYGLDFTPRMRFVELLDHISSIDGVERIRFTSPHPQEVRDDFIECVTRNPKICRHIHMPVQAGSDRILKAMNRNYRRARYLQIIEALRDRVSDMAITTDIIVGFPGETREDFEQTLSLMQIAQFDSSFSFMFSKRPGTPAEAMTETVSPEEKLARLYELQKLQDEITAARLQSWVGREVEVLVEGPTAYDPNCFQGRSSQNIVVNLEPSETPIKIGTTVRALIKEASRFTLRGEYLGAIPMSHPRDRLVLR